MTIFSSLRSLEYGSLKNTYTQDRRPDLQYYILIRSCSGHIVTFRTAVAVSVPHRQAILVIAVPR
jgi:hypothetical protein